MADGLWFVTGVTLQGGEQQQRGSSPPPPGVGCGGSHRSSVKRMVKQKLEPRMVATCNLVRGHAVDLQGGWGAGGALQGHIHCLTAAAGARQPIDFLSPVCLPACLMDAHVNLYGGLIDFLSPACLSDGPIRCGTWPTT